MNTKDIDHLIKETERAIKHLRIMNFFYEFAGVFNMFFLVASYLADEPFQLSTLFLIGFTLFFAYRLQQNIKDIAFFKSKLVELKKIKK